MRPHGKHRPFRACRRRPPQGWLDGTDFDRERAFVKAFRLMKNRISAFLVLPVRKLDAASLRHRVREIGLMEGASAGSATPKLSAWGP